MHDFRVTLRRLRSWLRASGALLRDDIPRRERTALRRMARMAGAARDAQVHWQWLTSPTDPMSAPATRAALWLADELRRVYTAGRERLARRAGVRWPQLAASLAEALAPERDPATGAADETLAQHLAPELARHLASARRALDAIEHRTQVKPIHRARIKVKRLRYLLEAVAVRTPACARALKQLRLLQDTLGELHDAHEFVAELDPLLVSRRGARGPAKHRPAKHRPALRDLRALRAALRRRELGAFRRSLDLLAIDETDVAWRYIDSLAARLGAAPPARRATVRTTPRVRRATAAK